MIFYVYVYLDPRKPGDYIYGDLRFSNEPFYVGKGKKYRYKDHLNEKETKNIVKHNKINKIRNDGLMPIIQILYDKLTNEESLVLEIKTIRQIGRLNIKTGPLTNLTDGGEGHVGFIQTKETKLKRKASQEKSTFDITVHSEEFKSKMSSIAKEYYSDENNRLAHSLLFKGKNNPMFGKKRSKESCDKQRRTIKQRRAEGKMKLSDAGRNALILKNKLRKGQKNKNIRIDAIMYELISPDGIIINIAGAVRLQAECKNRKLQLHVLKNNIGSAITIGMVVSKKIFAKNTIGWTLNKIQK